MRLRVFVVRLRHLAFALRKRLLRDGGLPGMLSLRRSGLDDRPVLGSRLTNNNRRMMRLAMVVPRLNDDRTSGNHIDRLRMVDNGTRRRWRLVRDTSRQHNPDRTHKKNRPNFHLSTPFRDVLPRIITRVLSRDFGKDHTLPREHRQTVRRFCISVPERQTCGLRRTARIPSPSAPPTARSPPALFRRPAQDRTRRTRRPRGRAPWF